MERKDFGSNSMKIPRMITVISLALGLLFDYFFFEKIPGISFLLYIALVLAGLFVIAIFLKQTINQEIFWLSAALIFFSSMLFIRSSVLLTLLNVAASLLLLLVIAEIFCGKRLREFIIKDYIKIFFLPVKFILPLFQTLSQLFLQVEANRKNGVFYRIVKGIVISIPILLIFILLFSSADLVFQKYILNLIHIDNEPEIIFRFILILSVTLAFIGAYTYIFQKRDLLINPTAPENSAKNSIGTLESDIILGSVNILFFVFIYFQFTYLFGGENNLSATGITYSEYARRGFFELIVVAMISLILLLGIEKYLIKQKKEHGLKFKILATVLFVQVIIIMISTFTRLSLYEKAYGFTVLRLYSHALNILLAVIFCLCLIKIYKNQEENVFSLHVFLSMILFLAAINFLNPDFFIAQRNIARFDTTGEVDIEYLIHLSDDAVPAIVTGLDTLNDEFRESFEHHLSIRNQYNNSPSFHQWQSLNLSRLKADHILQSRILELKSD